MSVAPLPAPRGRWDRRLEIILVVLAIVVAAVSAEPFSGCPNDGSRLATVEALVDHGTLAIDRSIFVVPPPPDAPPEKHGYREGSELRTIGTVDKVIVRGHYYSDKPPVPGLLLAGWYKILQVTIGLHVTERADIFCYLMTLGSSGLAFVVAVWASYRLGRALDLSVGLSLVLACNLGLATMAAAYTRAVNGHIQQLGVAVPMIWLLERLRQQGSATRPWRLLLLGFLGGFGYAIEQPTGGLLLAGAGLLVLWRRPGWSGILWLALGAFPMLALHHGVTYAIAGTWRPINSVPEYFDWPGCEFNASNMTGRWNHPSLAACVQYAFRLLFSDRGFLTVNLLLPIAVLAVPIVWWRGRPWRPEVLVLSGWCVGTWLVYAALSTNFSGLCLSVRWFLPLVASANYFLALLVRTTSRMRPAFLALTAGGVVQGWIMWRFGPWFPYPSPGIDLVTAATWCAVAGGLLWGLLPSPRGVAATPHVVPIVPPLPPESFGFSAAIDRHIPSGPERTSANGSDLAATPNGGPTVGPRAGRTAS